MSGAFNVWWLFLIIASIVMAGGTVALGIILCRGRRNRNNQPQNQNLLIENEEEVEVIGNNDLNLQSQDQILFIRNVDEIRNNLINESELHENIILESNGNLNAGRKDFVDREGVKQLVEIFAKIAEDWQNIANEVINLYDIKNYHHALANGCLKLQKISEYLTDARKRLVSIKNFPANIINSKLVSDFLDCLEKVVDDMEWVDDINKNYRKYVEECYVNMGKVDRDVQIIIRE